MDIAFVADKGGVGKTTLAYHVATRLRQLGGDVGLIDLDRRSLSSFWVAESPKGPYFPAYRLSGLSDELPDHAIRVWDTPAHPSASMQASLMELCEVVAIVAQADLGSHMAAGELYHQLAGQGSAAVRLVFNAMMPTSREGAAAVRLAREEGLACFDTVVRRYQCYQHAQWEGVAVCDRVFPSADNAWADITALCAEIQALNKE